MESGRIDNIDEALIAAEGERPIRDLAREEGVDLSTKEVFDRRAVERGEEFLNKHKEQQESLSGLVNPELHEIKEKLREINKQLEEELGGEYQGVTYVPSLLGFHLDEEGRAERIAINNLIWRGAGDEYGGIGPLGEKLKFEAFAHTEGRKEYGNDPYIVDAYNNDPEVKVLVDRLVELTSEQARQKERQKSILKEKEVAYGEAGGINAFLERIGHSKRVSLEFDPGTVETLLRQALDAKDHAKVASIGNQIKWALSVFDDLVITEKQEEDIGSDLKILEEKFDRLMGTILHAFNEQYPKVEKDKFENVLKSSAAWKRRHERGGHLLYSLS